MSNGGMALLLDHIARVRQEREAKLSSAIVESYREGITGEPSKMLEDRRFQDYMQGAGSSLQNVEVGPHIGTPEYTQPYKSEGEALAALNTVARPGTAGFTEYARQIRDIKTQKQLEVLTPYLSEHYGIDPASVNETTIPSLMKLRDQDLSGKSFVKREALTPDGKPGVQSGFADEVTGRFTPITVAGQPSPVVPRPQRASTGTLVMTNPDGTTTVLTGDEAILAKAQAGQEGRDKAKAIDNLRKSGVGVTKLLGIAERIMPLLDEGQEPQGVIGSRLNELRGIGINAAKLMRIAGFENFGDLVQSFDSPDLSEAANKDTTRKSLELSLAVLRVRAENPSDRNPSRESVERALKSNSGIFNSGDPVAAKNGLRELVTTVIQGHNVEARSLGEPVLDPAEVAPDLYKMMAPTILRRGEDVEALRQSKVAMTVSELRELRKGLQVGGPEALRVRKKFAGRVPGLDLGGQ
jgi:hypothetical protein